MRERLASRESFLVSEEAMLAAHEREADRSQVTRDGERATLLVASFVLGGLVFFSAIYLARYAGHFDSRIFNEDARPSAFAEAPIKIDPVVLGRQSFLAVCFTCHQTSGLGLKDLYPPLAGSERVNGSPTRIIRILLHGLNGPTTVAGQIYSANVMPAFGHGSGYNWSDEKIAATLTYIRQEWGNHSAPISSDQVAAIRMKEGIRSAWTQEELLKDTEVE